MKSNKKRLWIALLALFAPLVLLGAEKQGVCVTLCDEESANLSSGKKGEREMSRNHPKEEATLTPSKRLGMSSSKWAQKAETFVCTLAPGAQVERREAIRHDILSRVLSRERTDTAWVLEFPDDPALLTTLMEYIQLEKACCSFLQFELIVRPHGRGTELKLSGETEALDFVEQMMTEEDESMS